MACQFSKPQMDPDDCPTVGASSSLQLEDLPAHPLVQNTVQTGLNVEESVSVTVADNSPINSGMWTFTECLTPLPAGFITAIVQLYLARRSLRVGPHPAFDGSPILTKSFQLMDGRLTRILSTVVFGVLICASFAGAVCLSATGFLTRVAWPNPPRPLDSNVSMILITLPSAICDSLISAALALTLTKRTRNIGRPSRRTSLIVGKLVHLAIRTAAYTAIVATIGGQTFVCSYSLKLTD